MVSTMGSVRGVHGVVFIGALIAVPLCNACTTPPMSPAAGCGAGRVVWLGVCVEAPPEPPRCARGRALDLDRGECLPARDVRELARATGMFLADGDEVICVGDDDLVASSRFGRLACVAHPPPRRACPPGSLSEGPRCSSLVVGGAVDVARWARAAAVALCEALDRSPSVAASSDASFDVEIVMHIPDNDLTQAVINARAVGGSLAPLEQSEVDDAAHPLIDALRQLGMGPSSTSDVSASAPCRRSSRRPSTVAEDG